MAVFFFDGDQTLWDFQAMMRRALAATIGELRRLRPGTGGDTGVEAFVTDREVVAERLRGQVSNLEQVRFKAFRQSLARLGLGDDDLAAHLNEFYLQRRFADVMLYDDVLPVLAELRRNHQVGLLSPGEPHIMVGDSVANDVAGAEAVGWTGVWLNRGGAAIPEAVPELMIRSLHELLPMAKAL